jgi:hypothetical protein
MIGQVGVGPCFAFELGRCSLELGRVLVVDLRRLVLSFAWCCVVLCCVVLCCVVLCCVVLCCVVLCCVVLC